MTYCYYIILLCLRYIDVWLIPPPKKLYNLILAHQPAHMTYISCTALIDYVLVRALEYILATLSFISF